MSRREPNDAPPLPGEHRCVLPRWLVRVLLVIAAVQLATIVGLGVGAVYLSQQQQYIEGRGEQRDREQAEINQRIDDAVRQGRCELLDQLPPSPLLDRLRGAFGCGPGTPIEDLPPEIQDQLANRQPPTARSVQQVRPEQLPPREGPGPTDFPLPPQPGAQPPSVPPQPGADPAPAPPIVDLEPITDPLCEATGVCG